VRISNTAIKLAGIRPDALPGSVPTVDRTTTTEDESGLKAAVGAVVNAGRELAASGLVSGSAGNVSARIGELIAVTATGARLGELDPDQVTVVGLDGAVVGGRLAPTSELALHLEVYRRFRPGAIVHGHPPVATALGCVIDELPCIHPDLVELGGSLRVAPYQPFGSRAFAEATADALEGAQAVLMSNHGTLAIGDDPDQAVRRTHLLEWAAGIYWRAIQIGTPRVLSAAQQEELRMVMRRLDYGHTHPL
jgi:L-fuculose-phosphate aldolase